MAPRRSPPPSPNLAGMRCSRSRSRLRSWPGQGGARRAGAGPPGRPPATAGASIPSSGAPRCPHGSVSRIRRINSTRRAPTTTPPRPAAPPSSRGQVARDRWMASVASTWGARWAWAIVGRHTVTPPPVRPPPRTTWGTPRWARTSVGPRSSYRPRLGERVPRLDQLPVEHPGPGGPVRRQQQAVADVQDVVEGGVAEATDVTASERPGRPQPQVLDRPVDRDGAANRSLVHVARSPRRAGCRRRTASPFKSPISHWLVRPRAQPVERRAGGRCGRLGCASVGFGDRPAGASAAPPPGTGHDGADTNHSAPRPARTASPRPRTGVQTEDVVIEPLEQQRVEQQDAGRQPAAHQAVDVGPRPDQQRASAGRPAPRTAINPTPRLMPSGPCARTSRAARSPKARPGSTTSRCRSPRWPTSSTRPRRRSRPCRPACVWWPSAMSATATCITTCCGAMGLPTIPTTPCATRGRGSSTTSSRR